MNLSIIIPAFNEARRIGATLESLISHAAQGAFGAPSHEVLVVCDGCSDTTELVVRSFQDRLPLRVISYPANRGKGYAVRQGIINSTGEIVAFMDADGATPVWELARLTEPIIHKQAHIVIGSRRAKGARLVVPQAFHRRLLGRAFALHTRWVLGLPIKDTQCGFKVFQGPIARTLFGVMQCDGFAFDLELLAMAKACGLRVLEKGVEWHERPGSTVQPLHDGMRMLHAAWHIRARMRDWNPTEFPEGILAPPPVSRQFCEVHPL